MGRAPTVFSPDGNGRRDELTVSYRLTRQAAVHVQIRERGRVLRTISSASRARAGTHRVTWGGWLHGRRVPDGKYVASVGATTSLGTRRLARRFRTDTRRPRVRNVRGTQDSSRRSSAARPELVGAAARLVRAALLARRILDRGRQAGRHALGLATRSREHRARGRLGCRSQPQPGRVRPRPALTLEHDLAALEQAPLPSDVDLEPAAPVDRNAVALRAVDPDPAAAEEVPRAESLVESVQAVLAPGVVVALERDQEVGQHAGALADDAVGGAKRPRSRRRVGGELLACLVHVEADPQHDGVLDRFREYSRHPAAGL